MKQFDLEAAMRGEPVVTRDGRPFTFGGYNPDAAEGGQVAGWVGSTLYGIRASGAYKSDRESSLDLFMAPKKRTVWVNLYGPKSVGMGAPSYFYPTKEEADAAKSKGRIGNKAWPLEIEE